MAKKSGDSIWEADQKWLKDTKQPKKTEPKLVIDTKPKR